MNSRSLQILCGIVFVTVMCVPVVSAVEPLWEVPATTSGELSGVVISEDGSTIVAGGDQLMAFTASGKKRWSGWSGSTLAISRDGSYIMTSRDQTVRLISGTGTMLWDMSIETPVTEISMVPDASLLAAGGANRIRLISTTGDGIRQNVTMPIMNHFRLFPDGQEIVITSKKGIHTSNLTLFSEWADTNMTQDFVETSADGLSFVSVTNNRVRYYTREGSLVWDRALPGGNALGFAYSRDGTTIVVGRDDNTVQVLDHDGATLWTGTASHWVTSVAVSDNGNTIVTGSMDRTVTVYDRAGTRLGTFTAGGAIRSRSVAVSGDGSVIAAVDASTVYGFSRSQFTGPVTTPMEIPDTTTPVVTEAALPAVTSSETTPPLQVPADSPSATPKSAFSPAMPFAALALFAALRSLRP